MEHPFINDLGSKTLEELQKDITSLTTKLNFAYRTRNEPLLNQIRMALESYQNAYSKKIDEMVKSQKIMSQVKIDKK
jgi:hypothetical protein